MLDVCDVAFHRTQPPAARERSRSRVELDRTRIVVEDGAVVACSGAWTRTVSVPGGAALPMAGVTLVSVLPTHRRRGLLSAMMAAQLADARDRGEPLAGLWASEGAIYGRFGFGPATRTRRTAIARGVPLRTPPTAADGPVRLVATADAHPLLAPLHDRLRADRAGVVSRTASWWRQRILLDEPPGGEHSALHVALHADGYAIYRVVAAGDTTPAAAPTEVVVRVPELVALTPAARRALLGFLTSIDLATRVELHERPVDDELGLLVAAPQDLRVLHEADALWLRILDLPALVAARSWAADAALVLEVGSDDPALAGRWRLEVGPDGGAATRVADAADLVLRDRDLASIALGGTSPIALLDAGLADERRTGATAALDAAARTPRAPWTIDVF